MTIIGCDFHPSWQQVSWLDTESGECGERKLVHASGDARLFFQQLAAPVLIGMEATGNSQWFIELVEDLGHEIWIGDAAQIRASYVRKRDAEHIRRLVEQGRFPRLWTPDREQRDLRQLLLHRHKLVEIRSRVKNELQHLSLNKGNGAQVSGTTLLDAAHPCGVSRDRSHREQPAGAPGRRKLDRRTDWALSHP